MAWLTQRLPFLESRVCPLPWRREGALRPPHPQPGPSGKGWVAGRSVYVAVGDFPPFSCRGCWDRRRQLRPNSQWALNHQWKEAGGIACLQNQQVFIPSSGLLDSPLWAAILHQIFCWMPRCHHKSTRLLCPQRGRFSS